MKKHILIVNALMIVVAGVLICIEAWTCLFAILASLSAANAGISFSLVDKLNDLKNEKKGK